MSVITASATSLSASFTDLSTQIRSMDQRWGEYVSKLIERWGAPNTPLRKMLALPPLHLKVRKAARELIQAQSDSAVRVEDAWQALLTAVRETNSVRLPDLAIRELCNAIRAEESFVARCVELLRGCWLPGYAKQFQSQFERKVAVCEEIERHYPWPSEAALKEAREQYESGTLMSLEQFSNELQRAK